MSAKPLTERTVRTAKPQEKEYSLADRDGLELRIRPTGSKTWRLRITKNGKTSRKTIGTYPEFSLAQARELAQKGRKTVQLGRDVNSSISPEEIPKTLGELFDTWFTKYIQSNRKNQTDINSIESRFNLHVRPTQGNTQLQALARAELIAVLDKIVQQGFRRQANMALADLRQMFLYAAVRGWIPGDPLVGLKAKDVGGKKKRSQRILSELELRHLKSILEAPRASGEVHLRSVLPLRTELAVWLALSTLARSVEIATAHAEQIDLDKGEWWIPAQIAKNNHPHLIHLNQVSKAVFEILLSMQPEGYLFVGQRGREHIQPTAFTRELTDRQGREKPLKGRRNSKELLLEGGKWTMHDLRRTGATMMGELAFDKDLINLCLNHQEEDETTATYQLQKRRPERKVAFEALGAKLSKVLGGVDFLPKPSPRQVSTPQSQAQALSA